MPEKIEPGSAPDPVGDLRRSPVSDRLERSLDECRSRIRDLGAQLESLSFDPQPVGQERQPSREA